MSPETQTKPLTGTPQPPETNNSNQVVDSYAERLMNEVFSDVERVLEGGSLPKEPIRSQYVSLKSVSVPPIILPATLFTPPAPPETTENTVETTVVTTVTKSPRKGLDEWLFLGACASLGITLLLWLATRTEVQRLFVKNTPLVATPTATTPLPPPKTEAEIKFSNYMISALDNLAAQSPAAAVAANVTTATAPAPTTTINLSPLPTSVNLADASSLAQALNRLADSLNKASQQPVANNKVLPSPPKTTTLPIKPPIAAVAPVAKPSNVAVKPTPQQTVTISPTPQQTVTVTQQANATPQPTVTVTQQANATPQPTVTVTVGTPQVAQQSQPTPEITLQALPRLEPLASVPTPNNPVPSTPLTVNKLVGILELGERSVALFEIDGVPRRISIGESIGTSGWNLGQVSKDSITIRRNGEVRTISVGQQL